MSSEHHYSSSARSRRPSPTNIQPFTLQERTLLKQTYANPLHKLQNNLEVILYSRLPDRKNAIQSYLNAYVKGLEKGDEAKALITRFIEDNPLPRPVDIDCFTQRFCESVSEIHPFLKDPNTLIEKIENGSNLFRSYKESGDLNAFIRERIIRDISSKIQNTFKSVLQGIQFTPSQVWNMENVIKDIHKHFGTLNFISSASHQPMITSFPPPPFFTVTPIPSRNDLSIGSTSGHGSTPTSPDEEDWTELNKEITDTLNTTSLVSSLSTPVTNPPAIFLPKPLSVVSTPYDPTQTIPSAPKVPDTSIIPPPRKIAAFVKPSSFHQTNTPSNSSSLSAALQTTIPLKRNITFIPPSSLSQATTCSPSSGVKKS